MANTETTRSRKQGGSSFIPFAVALVAVALFIGWLATRDAPEPVAVVEPDAPAAPAADDAGPATTIQADALAGAGAQQYVGQNVQVENVEVITSLGAQLIWVEVGGNPYLVRLPEGTAAPTASRVRITGVVQEKNEAVLDQWQQTGVLESDDHRLQAEYGATYLQARRIEPAAG